ncbi:hypothetical protein H0X06_02595 [Candidatus Dependentiae bacterium]|nr:hypothetical protein [Candidatus Dependentiae bacterium]
MKKTLIEHIYKLFLLGATFLLGTIQALYGMQSAVINHKPLVVNSSHVVGPLMVSVYHYEALLQLRECFYWNRVDLDTFHTCLQSNPELVTVEFSDRLTIGEFLVDEFITEHKRLVWEDKKKGSWLDEDTQNKNRAALKAGKVDVFWYMLSLEKGDVKNGAVKKAFQTVIALLENLQSLDRYERIRALVNYHPLKWVAYSKLR